MGFASVMTLFAALLGALLVGSQFADAATKTALLIGGSGEDFSKTNVFLEDFRKFGDGLRGRDWEVHTLFNGKDGALVGSRRATGQNINAEAERLLQSSHPGDEVLFFLLGHGLEKQRNERSHRFMTEDQRGYNVDRLQDVAGKLRKKGVKVALLDLSCYSGATQSGRVTNSALSLLTGIDLSKVCIGTLAASSYVSVCHANGKEAGFTHRLIDLPPKPVAVSLKTQFLAARIADHSPNNFPQLSSIPTPGGDPWTRLLALLDPLAKDDPERLLPKNAALRAFQRERTPSSAVCEDLSRLFSDLEGLVLQTQQVSQATLRVNLEQLKDALREVADQRARLNEATDRLDDTFGAQVDWTLAPTLLDRVAKASLSWRPAKDALMAMNLNEIVANTHLQQMSIGTLQNILHALNSNVEPDSITWLDESNKAIIKALKPHRIELQAKYDETLRTLGDQWKSYERLRDDLSQKSAQAMDAERKLYQDYQSTLVQRGEDPCGEFEL